MIVYKSGTSVNPTRVSFCLYKFSTISYPKPVEIFPDHRRLHIQYSIHCRSFSITVCNLVKGFVSVVSISAILIFQL